MKKQLVKVTAVTMAGVMGVSALSSCSNDSSTAQTQGAFLWGIPSAVIAFIVAKASGADNKTATAYAIAAGFAAGKLGQEWGKSIVKKKAEYKSMEEYLDDNIEQLDKRIANVQDANKEAVKHINDLKKNNRKIAAADYRKIRKQWNANKKLVELDIKNARTAMKDADGEERSKLRSKLDTLQKERDAMTANISALSRLSAKG